MGKLLALALAFLGVWVVSCSASKGGESESRSRSALYGGTVIADASQVGIVHLEWVENQNDLVACASNTGVLITATTVLTAGHAADYEYAKYQCSPTVPKFLRITMPAPADAGGSTTAWISCGTACGEKLHPKFRGTIVCGDGSCAITESPTSCPKDCASTCGNKICETAEIAACPKDCPSSGENADGSDIALIETATTFIVGGDIFHARPITRKATSEFYNTKVTCYGMAKGAPTTFVDGVLRKADFTVLPFPHAVVGWRIVDLAQQSGSARRDGVALAEGDRDHL